MTINLLIMKTQQNYRILFAFIDFVFQSLAFIIVHDTIVSYWSYHYNTRNDISFGISLEIILMIYIALIFIQNAVIIFKKEKSIVISIIISAFFIFILTYFLSFRYNPLRTLNVALVGLFCIWIKFAFDHFLGKLVPTDI